MTLSKGASFLPSCIVAVTGASGAVYGIRLIEELLKRGFEVDLVASPSGVLLLKEEMDCNLGGKDPGKEMMTFLEGRPSGGGLKGRLRHYPATDLMAPIASGSPERKRMAICPCSMGTLARVASGISGNLIERAADCVLKERGLLVLVPRETPLNAIHLENMLRLCRAGAIVLTAMPGFYSKPRTIDDLVDFVVGKTLDALDIEHELFERWK